ncbi:unnamed protein product [Phytomonas sp. EM1]|nr:unnamed protein product [Phytomonas sp. EM1]|eukprot:CCW61141.1 unnamed protein product [Phytomonas sp. isolate EM1]
MDCNDAFEGRQHSADTLTIQTINEQQLAIQNLYEIISTLKARVHELEGRTDTKPTTKNEITTNPSVELVVSQNMRRRLFEDNVQLRQQVKKLTKANADLASELSSTIDAFNGMKNELLRERQVVREFYEKERQWQQEKSLIQLTECYCAETERNTSALCRAFQKAATENMDWRSLCYAIATRVAPASLRKYVMDQIQGLEEKYTDDEGVLNSVPTVTFSKLKNDSCGSKKCAQSKSRFLVPL